MRVWLIASAVGFLSGFLGAYAFFLYWRWRSRTATERFRAKIREKGYRMQFKKEKADA